MSDRAFRIGPIRPPSEANSLLIQITNGCTWNKCKFCNIYRHTKFKAYSADSIRQDIDHIAYWADLINRHKSSAWDIDGINAELQSIPDDDDRQSYYTVANWLLSGGENVFLQDGNSTALSSGRLTDVLQYLRKTFPQIKRITSYGRAENLSRSDAKAFAELKDAGLDRIHSGFETGSDEVLRRINKGVTQEQQIKAGRAIKEGGIELSIYFMPGVGGKDLSRENAEGTAFVINQVEPDFVRVRSAAVKDGTELYDDWKSGLFELAGDDDKVREIRRIIELAGDGISKEGIAAGSKAAGSIATRIVSDHMVNLLQDVEGCMGSDKERLLASIDAYLTLPETDRRVFQLLRRSLRAYGLEDLANLSQQEFDSLRGLVSQSAPREWDIKMNNYICRYI